MLERKVYMPLGGNSEQALGVATGYIDGNLTREEFWFCSDGDDAPKTPLRRTSTDNGKTWSFPLAIENEIEEQHPEGGILLNDGNVFDPAIKEQVNVLMRRQWPGNLLHTMNWDHHQHPFLDHCFFSSQGKEVQLKFEEGTDFDPENPFEPGYMYSNCSYYGRPELLPDGQGFIPLVCYPKEHISAETKLYNFNLGNMVLMRRNSIDGEWLPSNIINIDSEVSSRGLMEPQAVALTNGNILIVCRGSNAWLDPEKAPGRKWMTVSTDGGKTISPIEEFRYDDGTQFYSSSSIHSFFRSTRNGKLYWMANITDTPSDGNMPRHPLYICEIDEDKMAVRKDSLILVDKRREGEPDQVQLSNFSILENRETLDLEIYLTRLGEIPDTTFSAKTYQYIFKPE